MEITYYKDYNEMSLGARDLILSTLQEKGDSLLCLATGNSPSKTYQLLAESYQKQKSLFDQVRILKLDEWGGVAMNDTQTCESYLYKNIIEPLEINKERYFAFTSDPENPQKECEKIQNIIETQGPIDVCVLGLGINGHIGFNEPNEFLIPYCHVATLSQASMQHSMAQAMQEQPTYGMTLGIANILSSKKIILLVAGNNKKPAFEKLLEKRISTWLPASLLWLHPNVACFVDETVIN
ncbi:MAG: galactosamine-6-phosphate isomerase [Saprospiraceae bacterium]|nr:galactosamine-6-phosphate isomerase [Saprospiraceae bacterium]